jgi:malonyl-CoA O-methyltransferase
MPSPDLERSTLRDVDPAAMAHVLRRLHKAPEAPWLHTEVARRMAQRLPVIRLQPSEVIDWGAFLGASREHLARAYPGARLRAVETDAGACAATAERLKPPWWRVWQGTQAVCAADEVVPSSAQLLWSNMSLHGHVDPQQAIQAWQRALKVDGFLMFSTLGPGTLVQLQRLYDAQGWPSPMAPLVDMHDLGDMLVQAGFADPVMDQETVTLTWAQPALLLAELRGLGGNVHPRRAAGLRTPGWYQRLLSSLTERAGADGRIGMDFEIVYGHAFKAPPRARVAARTELPLADMQAMVRRGREG